MYAISLMVARTEPEIESTETAGSMGYVIRQQYTKLFFFSQKWDINCLLVRNITRHFEFFFQIFNGVFFFFGGGGGSPQRYLDDLTRYLWLIPCVTLVPCYVTLLHYVQRYICS